MRKITLLIASLFIAIGAMAEIQVGTMYRIKEKDSEKYMSVGGTAANTHGEVYGAENNEDDPNQIFTFVDAGDGKFYLKSNSGEYITYTGTGAGWNVNSDPSVSNAHALTFESVGDNENEYKIKCYNEAKKADKYFKWEYVGASGKYHPYNDSDAGAIFVLEEIVRNSYVHNTGNINRGDRGLTSFTITDGENSLTVNSIQTSAQAPVYVDKTAQKLTTKQGATLKFTEFNYTGSWMHAYAYIDYNKDYFFTLDNNNGGTGAGEIVSYNYFDDKDITDTPANQGSAIGNTYGESKAMPAFTLPRNLPAGEYRVRIKIDWNNLDADYGASDIAANGGCQCDFTIVVEEAVGNEIAWNALNNAVDEALALFNAVKIGTAVGSYSSSIDGYEAEFNDIMSYKSSITEDTSSDEIDSKTARVREIIASFTLNMPKAGDYIRIKAVEGWNDDARYLGAQNSTANTSRAEFVAEAGNNTIFYFDGENLVSYASGHYLVNNSSFLGYNGVQTNGTTVEFRTSNNTSKRHAYNISFKGNDNATRWLYTNTDNFTDAGSSCGTEGGYNFYLEPVTELPVTITSAKYATFYAPVAVEVPAGVTAHTVTINGKWATLNKIENEKGVIPAKTGVVLYSETANTYDFAITEDVDAISGNALRGTAATTYFTTAGTYYALGLVNGEVGFYKDAFNNDRFQNNSHKAYLYMENASQVKAFLFEDGETTAIETVETEKANSPIYDLSGRRVLSTVKGGIYIQNGKKFIVK